MALGRLDGISSLLPNPELFIFFYIRKEAVLSSQIEGTQSSLSDLLLFESDQTPIAPIDDVVEVSNYLSAMKHGLGKIKTNLPLSLRLLKEIHAILLAKGRGSEKSPGEFRTSQNWVGGSRPGNATYVPPPYREVTSLMGELELFLHDQPVGTPTLLKAALAHVQFESIHPFQDGNGRLGRLLITLLFCAEGVLKEPLLYLSLYFRQNRETYYDLLQQVRLRGAWEDWLRFFLEGVHATATQAVQTAQSIRSLFEADSRRVQELGKGSSIFRVYQLFQTSPFLSATHAALSLGLTSQTVRNSLGALTELNIVHQLGERKRNRFFSYTAYLQLLEEGPVPQVTPSES